MLNYVSRSPKNQRHLEDKLLRIARGNWKCPRFLKRSTFVLEADPAAKYRGKGEPNRQKIVKDEEQGSNNPILADSIHAAVVEEKSVTASSQKIICSESGLKGVQNDATDGVSLYS